jgi:hypothetical protein
MSHQDKKESPPLESPETLVRRCFRDGGCVRVVDKVRRKKMGQLYKKGYEVRLVVKTRAELLQVRELLRQVGFNPAKTFVKRNQIVQPIYGKAAVEWFLSTSVE